MSIYQVDDKFVFRRGEYGVAAIEFPENFINISSLLGFYPTSFDSACWRGYIATYSVYKKYLVLKDLYTNNGNDLKNEAQKLNNKLPKISSNGGWGRELIYENINLIIPYTGSVLISKDFIWEEFVNPGCQFNCNYKVVIQLSFNNGKYIMSKDLSDIVKQLREKNNDDKNYISNMLKSINSEWINNLFDISYSTRVEELFASGKIKIILDRYYAHGGTF
jgi:hypothetical protein